MLNKNPLVSVLIPCYNVSAFIERAVQSVLSQSYTNLEIWIIDDGSTDDTLQKIKGFTDSRIKVETFSQNTKKIGAVNEVLQKVNGDLIAFQDADDWSEPGRIGQQVGQFLQDPLLGICFSNFRYAGEKKISPGKIAITNEELRKGFLGYNKANLADQSLPVCATMMISKEALQVTKGYHPYFKGKVAEDIHWVYRILKNFRGVTVDKVLYNYYLRIGSLSNHATPWRNPKLAYSWQLLSKIIYKDMYESIDVLHPDNEIELKKLELDACEEALAESIQLLSNTKFVYENSTGFRIGKFILTPLRFFKR